MPVEFLLSLSRLVEGLSRLVEADSMRLCVKYSSSVELCRVLSIELSSCRVMSSCRVAV